MNTIPVAFPNQLDYGPNNITDDPKFVSPSSGDYRLRDDSPAINAGDNTLITDPNARDLDGKKRILGGRVDLGAYERWSFYAQRTLEVAEGATGSVDASAEDLAFFGGVTYSVESGPEGLSVNPVTGRVTWTPTEAQGPGSYPAVIRGRVTATPTATDTQTLTLVAQEVNLPPVLGPVPAQEVVERQTWSLTLAGSDPDLPANTLTYALLSGPAGVQVNATTGVVSWQPGEADGGQAYDLVFQVTDNGAPTLRGTNTVRLTVAKVNHPPTLAAMPNRTIPEGSPWTVTAQGADLDLPVQSLAYSVVSGPEGLTIHPVSGVVSWTPQEDQGPGTYPVRLRVQDPEGLGAEQTFTVIVSEVNQPPTLGSLPNLRRVPGQPVSLTLPGSDADVPANPLTYRLVSGPTNATVSAEGALNWIPTLEQAPSTNQLQVAVSDGLAGTTNSFMVEVLDLVSEVNGQAVTSTVGSLPPVTVKIRLSRPNWLVFYSLDGQEPNASSFFYLEPFALESSATLWPVAFSPDFSESVVGIPVRVNVLKPQALEVVGGEGLVHLGAPVGISGQAESGLPVSLRVLSGPARLENGQLIPAGGGIVRLEASQAGNDVWAPARLEVERTVARASQTVTWTPVAGQVFGGGAVTLQASASSGLPVSYAVVSGPGQVSGNQLSLVGAGTVVVRASQAGNADFEAGSAETSVAVAKAAQSLSFAALPNRAFSTNPVVLTASASSGLPVVFEVLAGPATVQGNQAFLTDVGTVILRASQPGNGNYEAALPKDQSFTVTPGTQTLSFAAVPAQTFGNAPVTLQATSSAGLPVSFRVLSGPGSLNGNVLSLTGAGSILVQAWQAGDSRYQSASTSQTVVVNQAAQSLTFSPLPNQAYTTNALVLAATASSGLPVGFRVVSGAASLNGNELRLTGVGTVAVAADQPGNTNWLAAASVTNSFTVSRGVQTITFPLVGNPVLGSPPITLQATSSAGLPITYAVLSGPATVNGNQLTLLNEGTVTVRALNPGSPLWLAAQSDQSFVIRKLTTLGLTASTGGTVSVEPLKAQYEPTDTVTLRATANAGFEFTGWSGDLGGTANPASLSMSANRTVTAGFRDIAPPGLAWALPVAGPTDDERVSLVGSVSDNAGVSGATWSRDEGPAEALGLVNGAFTVEGLVLKVGPNRFTVRVRDAAGNETVEERVVTWVPARVLAVGNAAEVQEGQRMVFPLTLGSPGDVAGLTFRLNYDPAYLTDPQLEWGGLVGQSVNNVNLATAGEISASFALAGTALPAGTNLVANVSFRARSVPRLTDATLTPRLVSMSSPVGAVLESGNAVVSGQGSIRPRRLTGDNNANQRIDIGDAVVISRLEVGLEPARSWDVGLNDLNGSATLDNGDVVRALRVVVGLDPAPAPRGAGLARPAAGPLGNTNDVLALEFPDGTNAQAGTTLRVVVRLARTASTLSGLNFTLNYPASAFELTSKAVGALVPGDALPLWNEAAGRVTLAAVRASAWPTSNGVAAVFTFTPNAGVQAQPLWAFTVDPAELTGGGFDIRAMDPVAGAIGGSRTPVEPPVVMPPAIAQDGTLSLDIYAEVGEDLVLETTTDLNNWIPSRTLVGQGRTTPVRTSLSPDSETAARFWRVRKR